MEPAKSPAGNSPKGWLFYNFLAYVHGPFLASSYAAQLIYDFKDGGSTFGLFSLNANLDPSDRELFGKLGIEMHSVM